MTVSASTLRADYNGNGSTTVFAVPFYFLDNTHLKVVSTTAGVETILTYGSAYSVTGAGNPLGGSITCTTAPANGTKISILRNIPVEQLTHYVPNDPFPAASHEAALDKLTMLVQQQGEVLDRALTLPSSDSTTSNTLPVPVAATFLGWNASANAVVNYTPSDLITVAAYGTTQAEQFSGTGAQTAFTLSASPGVVANLDVSIDGVTQRPGSDYNLTNANTLTFTIAPPSGTSNILIRYNQALPQTYAGAGTVTFQQAGTGAVIRTAQDKSREFVSVIDFGAVGNGTTDDSLAFQLAANASNCVRVPYTSASYLLNSGISAPNVKWIIEGKLTGAGGLPGIAGYDSISLFRDINTPSGSYQPDPVFRSIATSKGNNTTFIGGCAGFFEVRDRSDVTALNKGVLYGINISVVPSTARNNVPFDDCNGISIMNTTGTVGAKATDGIYLAHNSSSFAATSEWYSGLTIDSYCDIGIQMGGRYATYGISFKNANLVTSAAILFGNSHNLYWRNNSNTADVPVIGLDTNNIINLGGSGVSGTKVNTWFGATVPVVSSAVTYTVGFTDNYLIFNGSGCTVTLPSAGSFAGRIIKLKTTTAFTVISASSNVVPLTGGAAGTAILSATLGKWAELVSDGANWQIMAGN